MRLKSLAVCAAILAAGFLTTIHATAASAAPTITGTYNTSSLSNVDNYMKAMGTSLLLRKALILQRPTVTVSVNGSVYTIAMTSLVRSTSNNFVVGVPFTETPYYVDPTTFTTTVTIAGATLQENQTAVACGATGCSETWVFTDAGATRTLTGNGVTATIQYTRQ